MRSIKRQRVQNPADPTAPAYPTGSGNSEWQSVLAKDLPASVLGDVVAALLSNPVSQQITQAALARCRKEHGCTLAKQMEQLVEENVEEADEVFSRKMGSLAGSMYELQGLLDKAQQWIHLKGYEAAFELVWACVERGSDWEGRGSDSGGWDDWDNFADSLMMLTLDHMATDWTAPELDEQITKIKDCHDSGSAFGYESVFQSSLLKLKALKVAQQQ